MPSLRSSKSHVPRLAEASRDSGSELPTAEAELGGTHPLVALLRRIEEVIAQLVAVTALQGAGIVFASGGSDFGVAIAAGGAVGQVVCGCRVWALRACRRQACLELLLTSSRTPLYGAEAQPLREELGRARYLLSART